MSGKVKAPINNTFANAAIRATLKCEPRLAGLGLEGKITFNFDPPGRPPTTKTTASTNALAPARLERMKAGS